MYVYVPGKVVDGGAVLVIRNEVELKVDTAVDDVVMMVAVVEAVIIECHILVRIMLVILQNRT